MKNKINLSLLLFLSILIISSCTPSSNKINRIEDLGLSFEGIEDFVIKDQYVELNNQNEYKKIIAEKGNLSIRIETTHFNSSTEATNYINNRINMFESIFYPASSPYPGDVSRVIDCPEEFKPKKGTAQNNNIEFVYYATYGTERRGYGSCSWDNVHYKSVIAFIHCNSSNKIFQFEIFIPVNDKTGMMEKIINSITCTK